MKTGELEFCEANGVKLTEIKVGYDGIVVASSKDGVLLNISKSDLGKALTAKVPGPDGGFIENPYKNWSDVNRNCRIFQFAFMVPPQPPEHVPLMQKW